MHIPFCESVCYYCACNKVITRHHERAAEYLDALELEIDLVRAALGAAQQVSQLHFGGGTPTFLSDAELDAADGARCARAFHIDAAAPRCRSRSTRAPSTPQRLAHLPRLGFNRLSFGVQDFDPAGAAGGAPRAALRAACAR